MELETPPFMEKSILNFLFGFLNPSLIGEQSIGVFMWDGKG